MTFDALVTRYLAAQQQILALSTWLSYRSSFNKYWLPLLTGADIQDIDDGALLTLFESIDWPSPKTAKNNLVPLHCLFEFAFERNLIDHNPARRIRIRRIQRPRVDPFSAIEKEAILVRLARDAEPVTHHFFLTNFETGARTGELLALRWRDYDGKGLMITKTMTRRRLKSHTKTGTDRYVIATRRLRQALDAAQASPQDVVFANTKGDPMLDADWLNLRWRAALDAEGIRYRRAYNCRHTYATLGLMASIEPALLAQQLGHSVQIFHRNYARWLPRDEDEAAILKMEAYWSDASE